MHQNIPAWSFKKLRKGEDFILFFLIFFSFFIIKIMANIYDPNSNYIIIN